MADYEKLVMDLAAKLEHNRFEADKSAAYYDAKVRLQAVGIATPEPMRKLRSAIGWPRMYLDSIEERLDIEGFRLGESQEYVDQLTEWWQFNDLDEESGLAHLDALIYGRSYITVAAPGEDDDPDVPLIRVESPLNMYHEVDPRTRKVTMALRLYKNEDDNAQQWAALYLPNETVYLKYFSGHWVVDPELGVNEHKLGVVPVVPLLNRERLSDRDGRSEIIPELRSVTDAASRVMMNLQSAAELMAVPQRVLFGVDPETLAPNGTPQEVFNSYMANIVAVENEAGKAHQFQAAELMNYVNAIQEMTNQVASYTGLPPQYLAFSSDNPASAEAIRSAESRLVKKCERKARMFGGAWEQVMRLAMLVMGEPIPQEMRRLEIVWRDPSTPTYAAKADAVMKLYAAGQGVVPKEQARIDMGFTKEQRDAMKEWDKEDKAEMVKLADVLRPKEPANAGARAGQNGDNDPQRTGSKRPGQTGSGAS